MYQSLPRSSATRARVAPGRSRAATLVARVPCYGEGVSAMYVNGEKVSRLRAVCQVIIVGPISLEVFMWRRAEDGRLSLYALAGLDGLAAPSVPKDASM
jgi:hypothetical protein